MSRALDPPTLLRSGKEACSQTIQELELLPLSNVLALMGRTVGQIYCLGWGGGRPLLGATVLAGVPAAARRHLLLMICNTIMCLPLDARCSLSLVAAPKQLVE